MTQTIRLSKILVRAAMEDAAMRAARREIQQQTTEQLRDAHVHCSIEVHGAEVFFERVDWPEIPGVSGLEFEWVD